MVSQSDLEATQMDMGGPLETYGIYCVDATLGHFWGCQNSICFCLFSWCLLFEVSDDFVNFGVQMVLKRGEYSLPDCLQNGTFFDKAPKSGHSGVQEGSKGQKIPPNGAPGCQKRVQNGGFWVPTCLHVPFRCAPERYI